MTPTESIVKKQLEHYNNRNIKGFVACFAKDLQVIDMMTNTIVSEGLDDFQKRYGEMFEKSPKLKANVVKRFVYGSMVVDHEEVVGRMNDPSQINVCAIYNIKDGLINKVWFTERVTL